jgi:hypothetical protein
MTPEKSHALIKEWRQIVAERKSVDYRMARWSNRARAEFGSGSTGDEQFFKWLETELGLSNMEKVEALNLARSFKIVPDEPTWSAQGAAQIRRLIDLPKREQVAVLEAAKVEDRKIGSVLRGREEAAEARTSKGGNERSRAASPAAAPGDKKIIARFARGLSDDALADLLAEAIADQIVAAPPAVLSAAKRYATVLRRASKKAA